MRNPFRAQKKIGLGSFVPPPPPPSLERPKDLAPELLKRLEFKILRRLDGFLFGDYTGLFYGPSLDLAEVREYQPGDEVRRIDWNVTARTGTVHVRQYREEREIIAWLIVDLSPSMNFGTRRVLKRDGATEFAGLVASVLSRQGNKVGAIGINGYDVKVTPLGAGRKQAMSIVQGLLSLKSELPSTPAEAAMSSQLEERQSLADALNHTNRTLRRKALVFVVSDFIESGEDTTSTSEPDWTKALRRLAFKHDVIAVRVSDPAERELPKVGDLRLRDPETGEEVWIDTSDPRVRRAHAALVEARESTFVKTMRGAGIDVLELSTERDIVPPILKFTLRRSGRRS